jgi:hypothetical protein
MKVRTEHLIGVALDWAVAKCTNAAIAEHCDGPDSWMDILVDGEWEPYWPSVDWAQGGPIKEAAGIGSGPCWDGVKLRAEGSSDRYFARLEFYDGQFCMLTEYGPTELVAAMRLLVHVKIGLEVDVLDDLIGGPT